MNAGKTPVKPLLCRKSSLSAGFGRTRPCYRQSRAPDPVENRADNATPVITQRCQTHPLYSGVPESYTFSRLSWPCSELAGVSPVLMSGPP